MTASGTPLDEPAALLGAWTKALGAWVVEIRLDPHPRLVALGEGSREVGALSWASDGRYHLTTSKTSNTINPKQRFTRAVAWAEARRATRFSWYHIPQGERNAPQFGKHPHKA